MCSGSFDDRLSNLLLQRAILDGRIIAELRDTMHKPSLPKRTPTLFTQIQAPLPGSVTHYDWVLNLLRANSGVLSVVKVIDYLEDILPGNAKDRRKAVSSAIKYLVDFGYAIKTNGFLRLKEVLGVD